MRLTAAALKQRFAELRDLVNEWDPIGLIEAGAPRDEYECLVGPILRRLEAQNPVHEIAGFLDHQMVEHFGVSGVTGSLAFAVKVRRGIPNAGQQARPSLFRIPIPISVHPTECR
jgi:hypothetical protein